MGDPMRSFNDIFTEQRIAFEKKTGNNFGCYKKKGMKKRVPSLTPLIELRPTMLGEHRISLSKLLH